MKRGNDDEKVMGPMFPRLHVNDTDKGGPRAPPRNKMALYEQLSVPSQRYNIGAVSINPNNNNNNNNLVSSTSASQEIGRERNMCFPFYQQSVLPSHDVCHPETVPLANETTSAEKRKKPSEEDDFTVPSFPQSGVGQFKTQNNKDGERHTHQSLSSQSSRRADFISRQLVINRDGRSCRVSDSPIKSSDGLTRKKDGGSLSEGTYGRGGHQRKQRLNLEGNILGAENRYGEGASNLPSEGAQDTSSRQKDASHVGSGYQDAHEVDERMLRGRDDHLLERDDTDKVNDASETSMMDSVSGADISPDDVVGVIGRKHFWKARTAIVNQQRVLAIQVFELHRLIKVQNLIAGSPHLLLEGSAFVCKTSMNDSPVKKYSDYGAKAQAQAHTVKHKDSSPKPADKLEGTAENAVTKVPTPSQNAPQPTGYPSFSGPGPVPIHMPMPMPMPVPMAPANADPKMNPWGFQQPAAHQWLVPVMTPSEGLVYKPYPAPGMMGSMYGCCGPPAPSPMMGNMMNIPYVLPNPQYHHGMSVPPGGQFGVQGCFPTYAIPLMNTSISGSAVEQNQMNQFPGLNQYGCPVSQPTAVNGNHSSQHQDSCNMPIQENRSDTNAFMVFPPKEGGLLGSTASSPCERSGTRTGAVAPTMEGTDILSLFPTGTSLEISEEALPTDKTSRVIKVVPHNAKSTRESAARIFQFIQAERRQHESS